MEVLYPSAVQARDSRLDHDTAEIHDHMDLDIDLGSVDDFKKPVAVAKTFAEHAAPSNQIPDTELAPHKVYIRGLEDLTTSDIIAYSGEHYRSETLPHVEWIDDASANLVFEEEEIAMAALQHLTLAPNDNKSLPFTQLRAAKTLFSHPGSTLYVRIAAITDQKRPRAYEASRFYMMHPELDPREQRRRGAKHQGNKDYGRKGYPNDEHRRRRRRDTEYGFDPLMYDDRSASSRPDLIPSAVIKRGIDKRNNSQLRGDTYRPERSGMRGSRDRSASPKVRNRQTPPPTYRSRDPRPFPHENAGKELFPSIPESNRDADSDYNTKDLYSVKSASTSEAVANSRNLFSNRTRALEVKKELFPHKVNSRKHSRSGASDAADETADLFANGTLVPITDRLSTCESPSSQLSSSVFQSQVSGGEIDIGLSIRGASREQNQGFFIRGGAAVNGMGMIKELFPGKAAGNAR